jgi:hypothetical protein
VTCSTCGRDITGGPDEHVVRGEGHEVIEGFAFDRADFVSEPAYPQAGLLALSHPPGVESPNRVALHASLSKPDGAQGPQGSDPKPEGKKKKKKMESKISELRQELETLERENRHLRGYSDGALPDTVAYVSSKSAPAVVFGEGPVEAARYRDEKAGYDAYVIR